MLVLSRLQNEAIVIGGVDGLPRVNVVVVEIRGDKVRLGFDAPCSVSVDRLEVFESKQRSGEQKKQSSDDLCEENDA